MQNLFTAMLGAAFAIGAFAADSTPPKPKDGQIDYIEFGALDITATKTFYTAAFGWKFTDYGPDYCSFEDGRLTGGFAHVKEIARRGPLVVFYAADLEAMEAKVKAAGGTIVKPIFSFPGGRRFHFTDPSGNELSVWSDGSAPKQ
ncbi:MAG TPA: VOC family protein [Bryobacteraceae bacterium]|nr:VOC family protein [Bryobacteraceae bacterium]